MSKVISLIGVEQKIFYIRGQKVMLSPHLAELYGVESRILIQAVKRNIERFPQDFIFQLTWEEVESLRSQIVTLKPDTLHNSRSQIVILKQGSNVKFLPYAFTEQGIAMLSSVLRSKRAIAVNRFTKIRKRTHNYAEIHRIFQKYTEVLKSTQKYKTCFAFETSVASAYFCVFLLPLSTFVTCIY